MEEPVDETFSGLVGNAKTAIAAYKNSKDSDQVFIDDAEKSLEYFENIGRVLKMGFTPFEADRRQADNYLDQAYKLHRENARAAGGS